MSGRLALWLRLSWWGALLGFLVGGGFAAVEIAQADFVREFQAGAPSPWSERLFAIAMRAAVEGVGFGAVSALCATVALPLAALGRGTDDTSKKRAVAFWMLAGGAFAAWVTVGTWFTYEALQFLTPGQLAALNVGGFAVCYLSVLAWYAIAARLPWSPKSEPGLTALLLCVMLAFAVRYAFDLVMGTSGGWRSPMRSGGALILLAATAPGASWVAGKLAPHWTALGLRLPSKAAAAVTIVWLACIGWTAPQFSLASGSAAANYAALPKRGQPKGPNVVLITIDTLRADALGCYGYKRPTSPFIDSLAADGARFDDPVSAAAWTKPATGTILTGLYPSRHGAIYHGSRLMLPKGKRTLADSFRQGGYVTAGFVSNPNIKKVFDFDKGFDEYFDSPVEDSVSHASMRNSWFGRALTEITRHQFNWKNSNDCMEINHQALAWLDKNHASPFFLYLHYIDPHEPYSPPSAFEDQFRQDHGMIFFNKRKQLIARDLYDGEIRYTDDAIRAVVAQLKQYGIYDNTIIVLTADHGEEFFEHGALGHGFSLYQEVVHVPLIMHGPGVPSGTVVKHPVQIVDLGATILDLAKTGETKLGDGASFAEALHSPSWTRPGLIFLENEFGENEVDIRSFVFSGVRDGSIKFIVTQANAHRPPEAFGSLEVYDLASDPLEKKNLVKHEEMKAKGGLYTEKLLVHQQFLDEPGFRKIKPSMMDPGVAAELRAVGYLGGQKSK